MPHGQTVVAQRARTAALAAVVAAVTLLATALPAHAFNRDPLAAQGLGSATQALAAAAALPPGFTETVVFSGLTNPTAVRFSPDGRVFVAEKGGLIKVFDSLSDTDADGLRRPQHEGPRLLGPRACSAWRWTRTSPTRPYVYVLYTYDGAGLEPAPRWGDALRRRRPAPPTTAASSAAGCRA